jgi:hypothetical protein
LTLRSWSPRPPWSLGWQTTLHLATIFIFLTIFLLKESWSEIIQSVQDFFG